jgi:hypothetical protein
MVRPDFEYGPNEGGAEPAFVLGEGGACAAVNGFCIWIEGTFILEKTQRAG